MQVGMTKDQGLYNKPSAAVHPGALAVGTLPQYNTTHSPGEEDYLYKALCYSMKLKTSLVQKEIGYHRVQVHC